jgi:hypothetical protein
MDKRVTAPSSKLYVVSPIFERFVNDKVNKVARGLDQKFEELTIGVAG